MKERGIIFNAEMVRAILDGRKTQTRIIMKPQPRPNENGGTWWPSNICQSMINIEDMMQDNEGIWAGIAGIACPHGGVGDRLWVRETAGLQVRRDCLGGTGEFLVYKADNPNAVRYRTACGTDVPVKWQSPVRMKRHNSRITLEITDVRVEHLQSISEEDAKAEGVIAPDTILSRSVFHLELWEQIYGADSPESWSANPWVWVIEFKRV
ncbi:MULTISPECIES: hypothetical protein [Providencia]|uniref:hypothetical protein n=1 Tax=Providencia TaxID=586 RepID=UPI0023AA981A|nr:hypothetical protein [Providencia rettgeri]